MTESDPFSQDPFDQDLVTDEDFDRAFQQLLVSKDSNGPVDHHDPNTPETSAQVRPEAKIGQGHRYPLTAPAPAPAPAHPVHYDTAQSRPPPAQVAQAPRAGIALQGAYSSPYDLPDQVLSKSKAKRPMRYVSQVQTPAASAPEPPPTSAPLPHAADTQPAAPHLRNKPSMSALSNPYALEQPLPSAASRKVSAPLPRQSSLYQSNLYESPPPPKPPSRSPLPDQGRVSPFHRDIAKQSADRLFTSPPARQSPSPRAHAPSPGPVRSPQAELYTPPPHSQQAPPAQSVSEHLPSEAPPQSQHTQAAPYGDDPQFGPGQQYAPLHDPTQQQATGFQEPEHGADTSDFFNQFEQGGVNQDQPVHVNGVEHQPAHHRYESIHTDVSYSRSPQRSLETTHAPHHEMPSLNQYHSEFEQNQQDTHDSSIVLAPEQYPPPPPESLYEPRPETTRVPGPEDLNAPTEHSSRDDTVLDQSHSARLQDNTDGLPGLGMQAHQPPAQDPSRNEIAFPPIEHSSPYLPTGPGPVARDQYSPAPPQEAKSRYTPVPPAPSAAALENKAPIQSALAPSTPSEVPPPPAAAAYSPAPKDTSYAEPTGYATPPPRSSSVRSIYEPQAGPQPHDQSRAYSPKLPVDPTSLEPTPLRSVASYNSIPGRPTNNEALNMGKRASIGSQRRYAPSLVSQHSFDPSRRPASARYNSHDQFTPRPALDLSPEQDLQLRRRGHPIVSFAFGGEMVVSVPQKVHRFTKDGPVQGSAPGLVRWIDPDLPVGPVLHGPLFGSKGPDKSKLEDVRAFLEAQINVLSSHPEQEPADIQQDKLVLLKVLSSLLACNGIPDERFDTAVRTLLLQDSTADDETASESLTLAADLNRRGPQVFGKDEIHRSYDVPKTAINEIQRRLLKGNRKGAVHIALEHQMWSHALVISSSMTKESWLNVVKEFVRTEFESEADDQQTLRMLYQVLAGGGASSIDELSRPVFELRNPSHVQASDWKRKLAALWLNKASGSADAIMSLGKLLANSRNIYAAHTCFILSNPPSLFAGPEIESNGIVLIGVDHRRPSTSWMKQHEAIELTEIYEYILALANPAFGVRLHTLPFKLVRAWQLADSAQVAQSRKYCEYIGAELGKMTKASNHVNSQLVNSLRELSTRLLESVSKTSDVSDSSWFGRGMSRPKFDTFWTSMEGKLNKFVTGENETLRPSPAPEEGPFAKIGSLNASSTSLNQLDKPQNEFARTMPSHQPIQYTASPYAPNASYQPNMPLPAASQGPRQYQQLPSQQAPAPTTQQPSPYAPTSYAPQDSRYQEPPGSNYVPSQWPNHPVSEDASSSAGVSSSYNTASSQPYMTPSSAGSNQNVSQAQYGLQFTPMSQPHGVESDQPAERGPDAYVPKQEPVEVKEKQHQSQESQNNQGGGWFSWGKKAKTPEPPKVETKKEEPEKTPNSGASSWFGWGKKKDDGTVYKAKLGEQSDFYYDKDLKRWVNKSAKLENEVAAPPPPPKMVAKAPATSQEPPVRQTPEPPAITQQAPVDGAPVSEGFREASVSPTQRMATPPQKAPPPARSNIATANSIDDLLGGPPVARGAAAPPNAGAGTRRGKAKAKGRYVDVMQGPQ